MNKARRQRSAQRGAAQKRAAGAASANKGATNLLNSRAARETVESIALAVILAFIFRAYQAEAFVIPTGSMASTLMGRHIDVRCEQCDYRYSSGASAENDDRNAGMVVQTICPICRYPTTLAREGSVIYQGDYNPNEDSFNGDRLVVDKVTYLLSDPERWDVIVFKYPYNTKQNYIKRLVGLPGETIRIKNGDIFARQPGQSEFKICRKSPYKLRALLQIVDDTYHLPNQLVEQDGPSRWQQWSVNEPSNRIWKIHRDGNQESYSLTNESDETVWLRYRHIIPELNISQENGLYWTPWRAFFPFSRLPQEGGIFDWTLPDSQEDLRGQLITDLYAYNDNLIQEPGAFRASREPGYHWAGDLAVECIVTVEDDTGELLLELVEGGIRYRCTFDVSSGRATLSTKDDVVQFLDAQGEKRSSVSGETKLHGQGTYHLRFANADDELTLWVDEQVIEFDHPAQFHSPDDLSPKWSPEDPGDAEPVGIGGKNVSLKVNRIRILRDLYYHAMKSPGMQEPGIPSTDYADNATIQNDVDRYEELAEKYDPEIRGYIESRLRGTATLEDERIIYEMAEQLQQSDPFRKIQDVLQSPERWNSTDLFTTRRQVDFELNEGQYLPMGDNSPSSKDARIWGPQHYVESKWLIGKAQFVFWPHSWRRPVPYWPNFDRFRFVR